ncbi:hypothetical protein SDC9_109022 [bioreactor metagenome]|uniref:Uncharacterized protein n=1 Tax=bioreactor metagenome TaxID=1076179 RepID=A0A645BAQ5_9ZZZZ
MKDHAGGIQGEGTVRHDARIMPALVRVIVHQKHVVRKGFAEHKPRRIGLGLEGAAPGDGDFLHDDRCLLNCRKNSGGPGWPAVVDLRQIILK